METSTEINKKKKVRDGLNRTMQYGNYIVEARAGIEFPPFKSYYVVWKQ